VTPAVEVEELSRTWGSTLAVDKVSFAVEPGELFGVIGPDGAGKTTLFRMLATLLLPDHGSAQVLGHDTVSGMWAIRRRLGYMPGRFSLYPDLTVAENLAFFAAVFGTTVSAAETVIGPIWKQLVSFSDRRAGALSGGMKQKLALCCALVHRPELLILDEPTTGVDAVSRREFWDLLSQLSEAGLAMVVSTPYMDEAIRCNRVALMQQGRLLGVGTPAALSAQYSLPLLAVRSNDRLRLLAVLRQFPHAAQVWPFGSTVHYTDKRTGLSAEMIANQLITFGREHDIPDLIAEPIVASVEDVFIHLMTQPLQS
jgi:ABC-type multidrug transport system ATPase subunit